MMENNINEIAFLKRCIKENGEYNNSKKIIKETKTIYKNKINYYNVLLSLNINLTKYIYKNYEKIIQNEFKRFLKQNNIYEDFFKYVDYNFVCKEAFYLFPQCERYNNKKDTLFKNINYPHVFVRDAFSWGKTKQGYEFWREIHAKWQSTYYEIEKSIINGTYNK